jgi:hypothetical protein
LVYKLEMVMENFTLVEKLPRIGGLV